MSREHPNYYAVIPADVRYDSAIAPNAKLLFGEISALCNADGVCTARNEFFAEVYGFSERSVRNLLAALEEKGYIRTALVRDEETGQVVGRVIVTKVSAGNLPADQWQKISTSGKYFPLASGKNLPLVIKKNNIYIPPEAPQGGGASEKPKRNRRECKTSAETLPERFEKFWSFYRSAIPKDRTAGNRQAAIRAWDKLAPDADLVTTMATRLAQQVKTAAWQSGIGVPHASTWLNNRGWEDDWGEDAESSDGESSVGADGEEGAIWVT